MGSTLVRIVLALSALLCLLTSAFDLEPTVDYDYDSLLDAILPKHFRVPAIVKLQPPRVLRQSSRSSRTYHLTGGIFGR